MSTRPIAIDATFVRSRISGIERYCIQLIEQLAMVDAEREYVILAHRESQRWDGFPPNFKVLKSPFRNRVLTDQLWVPIVLRKLRPALVHFPAFSPPLWCPARAITTIHDAVFWRHPETLSRGGKWYYKPLINRAAKRGKLRHVITISENSCKDLIRYLDLDPHRIVVIPQGVPETFHPLPVDRIEEIRARLGLPARYILAVGTLEPRKNFPCLLKAFEQIARAHASISLVLVGRKGWGDQIHVPEGLRQRIVMTGAVNDEDLVGIYAGASVFAFPSSYEGFGLPLLEAMACGVPCVAANDSSLPEVGGEACLYANPDDPDELAGQIHRVLCNPDLAKQLRSAGQLRAQGFTWAKTAESTRAAYHRAAAEPVNLLGFSLAPLTIDELLDDLERRILGNEQTQLATVNVDFFVLAERYSHFKSVLRRCELLVADGMPVVWAANSLGNPLPERVTGSDLAFRLCEKSARRGFRIFFLGAARGIADEAKARAEERYPGVQIVGTYAPEAAEIADAEASGRIVELINGSGANILLVAFGAPKQEYWIARHRGSLRTLINIGVGASIDFIAGRVSRAPRWMQRTGLEWLFRLLQEPRRLWRRYLVEDLAFFRMFLGELLAKPKSGASAGDVSEAEVPQVNASLAANPAKPPRKLGTALPPRH